MIDWEDRRPAADQLVVGETLERLSVDELAARIVRLEREIERVRAEMDKKKAHEASAAAIFKK